MSNLLDYLDWRGDLSLESSPFNEVDNLLFAELSFLDLAGIVPDVGAGESVELCHAVSEYFRRNKGKKIHMGVLVPNEIVSMAEKMAMSCRFAHMRLNCFHSCLDTDREVQFAALTIELGDGTIYIAFRGTDETIVGWKEDFNMAFLSPVPAQAYSVKYLNMVMGRIHRPFYVGGHSKGGNLAVYSAMKCLPQVQNRILKVYSMDGPGFRPEVLAQGAYEKIADRVVKILPHSSMVGMLFERDIHYQVVESRSFGLAQHDPYSWLVDQGEFVKVDDIYERRRRMNDTLNEWILSLDEEKLRTFVDTLYQVVSASEAEDLIAFTSHWRKSMNGVIGALKEVDHETAKMLREIVKSLFEIAGSHVREQLTTHSAQGKGHEKHKPRRTKDPESVSRTK